jgi:gluconokinase
MSTLSRRRAGLARQGRPPSRGSRNGVRRLGAKIVVMGVTGAGKTTLGQSLADLLAVPYADGDSFHSDEAIRKMSAKQPLNDHDREPWLSAIGSWLCRMEAGGVVSCSALRRRYRDALVAQAPDTFFIHLAVDQKTIAARLALRREHFMPEALIASQFAELEPLGHDEAGCTVDGGLRFFEVCEQALTAIEAAWPSLVVDRSLSCVAEHTTESDRLLEASVDTDKRQKEK